MTGFILGFVTGAWLFGFASFLIGCWLGYDMGKSDARDAIDTPHGDVPTHPQRPHHPFGGQVIWQHPDDWPRDPKCHIASDGAVYRDD